jgi:hypothetical protein
MELFAVGPRYDRNRQTRKLMYMTNAELESVAEGWIRYQLAVESSTEQAENWNSVSTVFDIRAGDPNVVWQLILHAISSTKSVACSPLVLLKTC